jgi:hypothetical protein
MGQQGRRLELRVLPVEVELSKSDLLLWGNLIDTYTAASSQEHEACSSSTRISSGRPDEREDEACSSNTYEAFCAGENVEPHAAAAVPSGLLPHHFESANEHPDPVRESVGAQDDYILDLLGYHEYDVTFEEKTLGLQLEQMGEMAVVTGLNGFVPGPFKTTPAVRDIIVAVDGETVLRCSFETIISLIQTSSRPTTIRFVVRCAFRTCMHA